MTKKEMTEIFTAMMLAWPNAEMFKGGIQKLGPTIALWTISMSDVDFWTAQQAVVKLCRTSKFPPTIAEMREQANVVNNEIENEVRRAYLDARNWVRLCSGDLKKAFERMTPRSQHVIQKMGGMEVFAPPDSKKFEMKLFEHTYKKLLKSSNALSDGLYIGDPETRKKIT